MSVNRKVTIQGFDSYESSITGGVPQGLQSLFFIIYMSYVIHAVNHTNVHCESSLCFLLRYKKISEINERPEKV